MNTLGDHMLSINYRVGMSKAGYIGIDLCNSDKQYLLLNPKQNKIHVYKKDQLSKVPKEHRILFYCDDDALPLLQPEKIDAVVSLAQEFQADSLEDVDEQELKSYGSEDSHLNTNYKFALDLHEEQFKSLYSNLPEDDFALLRAWIAYSLITPKVSGNVFPVLFLSASMGQGKTVIFRQILHTLCDPRTDGVARFNKNLETMGLLFNKGHCVLLDNMRQLTKEHSDFFCNTATGSNEFKRELYTNGELYRSELHAAVAMNGIHDTITEPDLISRTVFINSQAPKSYLDEEVLRQHFQQGCPWFFAVILRDAMRMLYHLQKYPDSIVHNRSRLVRFSRCLSAMDSYRTSETLLVDLMVERQQDIQKTNQISDPLVETLYKVLIALDGEYRGTSKQLLELLNEHVAEDQQRPGWWPERAQDLYYRMQEREAKLKRLKIINSYEQPERLNPRKGEVVYQIIS